MSDLNNRLQDDALEGVSGGERFPVDDKGNVLFTGADGKTVTINPTDWAWLRSQINDPNPDEFLKDVPGADIDNIIANRKFPK